MQRPRREEMLRVRLRTRDLELLRTAGQVSGQTVSELVRGAALTEAKRLISSGGR
jgi:uncharacterized protein (DUF1778 family)